MELNQTFIYIFFTIFFVILWHRFCLFARDYIKPYIKEWFKKALIYILDWRFMLCFTLAWMITNGWCYVFIFVGGFAHINWMRNIGLGYLAFLWLPTTPEKIVTIPIAIGFRKWLFPKHAHLDNKLKEQDERTNNKKHN